MTRRPDDVPEPEKGDERGGVDVEAAWAQIVAHWDDEPQSRPRHARPDATPDGTLDITVDITDGAGRPTVTGPTSATGGSGRADPTDPTDPADPANLTDPANPVEPESPAPRSLEQPRPFDGSSPDAGAPHLAHDPLGEARDARHRLTPEDVAQLDDGGWGDEHGSHVDDRRSHRDWRRSWHSPASHVGGEEARTGSSAFLEDDPEDGYEPPEPPPLPRGDLISTLAWAGALGAPLFLLLAALFWRTAPSLLVGAVVAAFIAGFMTLVVRMPDRPDDDDDGAVV